MKITKNSGSNMTKKKMNNREKILDYYRNNRDGTMKGCAEATGVHYNTVGNHATEIELESGLNKLKSLFPKHTITDYNEMVLRKKDNIYFILTGIKTKFDLDCKILEFLSRPSTKSISLKDSRYFAKRLNEYFERNWDHEEMSKIYTYLGNGCNRKLCVKFIKSGFDFDLLKRDGDQ